MKTFLHIACILLFSSLANAQEFTGQWKGGFGDRSSAAAGWGGNDCDYVLELTVKGNEITGYSYTYFSDAGQKYYTICKIVGTVNRKSKTVVVTETERTKTNVPVNITNCFQVHTLTYSKEGMDEILDGKWAPAPNQMSNCGFGVTRLTRRSLVKSYPRFSSTASNNKPVAKKTTAIAKSKTVAKKPTTIAAAKKSVITGLPEKPTVVLKRNEGNQNVIDNPNKTEPSIINKKSFAFEKRSSSLIKTLEVINNTVKVMLYDNGEIDGDSVSVFYNNELLASHERLSEKAITFTLTVPDDGKVNELVMYAENLGRYPPNTALMVVTDGTNRYEVRITSDLQKSGTIRFIKKKN